MPITPGQVKHLKHLLELKRKFHLGMVQDLEQRPLLLEVSQGIIREWKGRAEELELVIGLLDSLLKGMIHNPEGGSENNENG